MPVNISLDEAIRQRQAAVTACLARIRSTPSYRAEGEKRDLAAAKLEFSRKYGSPEDRLKSSHDFVVIDQKLKAMEKKAVEADPAIKSADAAIGLVKAKLDDDEQARISAAAAERQRIANDPINVAIREGKIIVGMTEGNASSAFANRKRRNFEEGHGGGSSGVGIDMSMSQAMGTFNVEPQNLIRKTQDDFESGAKRVTFTRYLRYMNGGERRTDEVVVIIRDGKVTQVMGQ